MHWRVLVLFYFLILFRILFLLLTLTTISIAYD